MAISLLVGATALGDVFATQRLPLLSLSAAAWGGGGERNSGEEEHQAERDAGAAAALTAVPECLTDPDGPPTAVVLMSLGHSGSTVLWQVLASLTGSPDAPEYVGGRSRDEMEFFDVTVPAESKLRYGSNHRAKRQIGHVPGKGGWKTHGEWLVGYLCHLRKQAVIERRKGEGGSEGPPAFVGFKWKPFWEVFREHAEAGDTLGLVASLAAAAPASAPSSPPVRVLRNRRNPLDVVLSRFKHTSHPRAPHHCFDGGEACLKLHQVGRMLIDNVPRLFSLVLRVWRDENRVDAYLRAKRVPVEFVSYDDLFYPPTPTKGEEEWGRAVRFVSPKGAPRPALPSWSAVQHATKHLATTLSRNHMDIIENWEDVYEVFKGTEIEHFLRLD